MSTIQDSILNTTKKALGLETEYEAFDVDVIMHINSIFATLNQLGIGPAAGFRIDDAVPVWSDFLLDEEPLNFVKSYMYLKVRMLFDPPTTSYLIEAFNKQADELEWRINVHREYMLHPVNAIPEEVI